MTSIRSPTSTSLTSRTERSWPTASGVSVSGKVTESRSGRTGSSSGQRRVRRGRLALGPEDLDHSPSLALDRDRARRRRLRERQLDGQDPVLVGGLRGVGLDVDAERDHAPERPVLDLELLVDALLAALGPAVAGQHELAPADLELDLRRVDAGQVGPHDGPRRVGRVVDVDGGREAAPPRASRRSKTSPNSSSISRRMRSKLANRSRS